MCGRVTLLTVEEVRDVLASLRTGEPLQQLAMDVERDDAFPGSRLHALSWRGASELEAHELIWGFSVPYNDRPVFNARVESIARGGMWDEAFEQGRCIVPVRRFFEPHRTQTAKSPKTGRSIKQQYTFEMPGQLPLLLAGIEQDGRVSVVTTEPNEHVSPVHPRMPLVLAPHEVRAWADGDIERLADRSGLMLQSSPEHIPGEQQSLF